MHSRGQVAFEYLMLLGVLLFLIAPMVAYSLNTSATQGATNDAEVALARIAGAAESVYAQGVGAKQTVSVYLPDSSDLGASTISGRIIRLRIFTGEGERTDVVRIMAFNVTGAFPATSGYREITVETLTNATVKIS